MWVSVCSLSVLAFWHGSVWKCTPSNSITGSIYHHLLVQVQFVRSGRVKSQRGTSSCEATYLLKPQCAASCHLCFDFALSSWPSIKGADYNLEGEQLYFSAVLGDISQVDSTRRLISLPRTTWLLTADVVGIVALVRPSWERILFLVWLVPRLKNKI